MVARPGICIMEQIRNYGDERQTSFCCYCGRDTGTRDHVPSKVFLDKPYPENLPVVGTCQSCNQGYSLDEEYVACLIECARLGVTDPNSLEREKVRKILRRKPALQSRIEQSKFEDGEEVSFNIEYGRFKQVLSKLVRGHALFELNEPRLDEPDSLQFGVLGTLSEDDRRYFEQPPSTSILPEVGSRAMQRIVVASSKLIVDWLVVQPNRYRYLVSVSGMTMVRIVLSEYLWCEAIWR